jgi:nucleotide-binding universal stress UspA family protein
MVEITRILCPTDFSKESEHALRQAITLATWYKAELVVLNVYSIAVPPIALAAYPVLPGPPDLFNPAETRAAAHEALARFAGPAQKAGLHPQLKVEGGDPVRVILAVSESDRVDLIVMGTHGRSGADRWMLGSVTEKVLRKARCPVMTVPPATAPTADALVMLKRILCPIDFSEASLKALEYAVSLAQEADATLSVLHVVEGVPEREAALHAHFDLPGFIRAAELDALGEMRRKIPESARSGCTIEELIATGKAYREILSTAQQRDAHLIVMGVYGRNPFDLLMFGSTTNHVVRAAHCPVLTVRARSARG